MATEPLLVTVARKRATHDPHQHIRIIGGSGTTVAGFVAELDEWEAGIKAEAWDEAVEALAWCFRVSESPAVDAHLAYVAKHNPYRTDEPVKQQCFKTPGVHASDCPVYKREI